MSSQSRRRSSAVSYQPPFIRVTRFTSGLPRVVILNDHAMISEVLELLLVDRIEIVGETRSGKAAVALSELFVPDVVVASENFIDGVIEYYIPALLKTGVRILLVAQLRDTARLLELVAPGVTGIVGTDQTPVDLADAVLQLASGGAALPPDVVEAIAADWRRIRKLGPVPAQASQLTSRELDVLGAMSDGLSTKAVAHHLGIAVKTVENHKTRIFDKLGVRTQTQAVALALSTNAGHTLPASGDAPPVTP